MQIFKLTILILLFSCTKATDKNYGTEDRNMKNSEQNSNSINSNHIASLEKLASLLYDKNQYKEAIDAYSKLILIDSLNGQYYFRSAYCHMQINQDQDAVVLFSKAADLNFEKYDAYKNIGLIYCKSAMYNRKEAIKYFERYLEINPNDEVIKRFSNSLRDKDFSNTH